MATWPASVHPELIPTTQIRNPDLPHQIVIMRDGVSCNCRRYQHNVRVSWGDRPYTRYEAFASARNLDEAIAAYYDPANHIGLDEGDSS